MIFHGISKGERLDFQSGTGLLLAFGGLILLLLLGATAPSLVSAQFAGIARGVHSILGRRATNPLKATSWNFIGTLSLVLIAFFFLGENLEITQQGFFLAILSGAIASGIGYAILYSPLLLYLMLLVHSAKIIEVGIEEEKVLSKVQPFFKQIPEDKGPGKTFMKVKNIFKFSLENDSAFGLENLKEHGLKGMLMGPRNLDNNLELLKYVKGKVK